jgi:hypothetical protein
MGNPNGGLRHGHKTRNGASLTYKTWRGMRERCNRPGHKDWPNYGGKGVTVCVRWDRFENFLADMGERPEADSTIDRIDYKAGYSPENCRWVHRSVQTAENNSRLKPVEIDGISYHSISAACRAFGISRTTVNMRLSDGHDLIEAITTPVRALPNRRPRESYLPKAGTPPRKRVNGRFV